MPVATIATNAAMSGGRSTLRRMIISGSESAITDIMNASTVPSAAPFAEERLHDGDDAGRIRVHRHAEQHRERHRPPRVAPHERGHEVRRNVSVDAGADGDSENDVDPDLADDLSDGGAASRDPIRTSVFPNVSSLLLRDWISHTHGSTCRSSFSRPIVQPARIAIPSPVPR